MNNNSGELILKVMYMIAGAMGILIAATLIPIVLPILILIVVVVALIPFIILFSPLTWIGMFLIWFHKMINKLPEDTDVL